MRFLNLILCNVAALMFGLASFAVVAAIWSPGTLAYPIAAATIATLMYFSGPLLGASALALWRREPPRLYVHGVLSIGWWIFLVCPWALKPWHYYGVFPWKGVAQVWLPILPSIVTASAAFWLVSMRSNPRLQRTALRAAAEPPGR